MKPLQTRKKQFSSKTNTGKSEKKQYTGSYRIILLLPGDCSKNVHLTKKNVALF